MTDLAKPPKRNRAAALTVDQHDDVVSEIMIDMCEGRWRTGISHRQLAARFGVAVATVEGWASEASRFLRMCRGSEDQIRELILSGIENLGRLALEHQKLVYADGAWQSHPEPDLKALAAALDLRARVYGLVGSTRGNPPDAGVSVPIAELMALLESEKVRGLLTDAGYALVVRGESRDEP